MSSRPTEGCGQGPSQGTPWTMESSGPGSGEVQVTVHKTVYETAGHQVPFLCSCSWGITPLCLTPPQDVCVLAGGQGDSSEGIKPERAWTWDTRHNRERGDGPRNCGSQWRLYPKQWDTSTPLYHLALWGAPRQEIKGLFSGGTEEPQRKSLANHTWGSSHEKASFLITLQWDALTNKLCPGHRSSQQLFRTHF